MYVFKMVTLARIYSLQFYVHGFIEHDRVATGKFHYFQRVCLTFLQLIFARVAITS